MKDATSPRVDAILEARAELEAAFADARGVYAFCGRCGEEVAFCACGVAEAIRAHLDRETRSEANVAQARAISSASVPPVPGNRADRRRLKAIARRRR